MADDSYAWINQKRLNFVKFMKSTNAYGQLSFARKTLLETFWTMPIEELLDEYAQHGPAWRLEEPKLIRLQLENQPWRNNPGEFMRAGEVYENVHSFWMQLDPDEQTTYERYLALFAGFLFRVEESFRQTEKQPDDSHVSGGGGGDRPGGGVDLAVPDDSSA